jgi:hypothetical protein
MNKICTSIEQSNKLIELGLDVNTADMFWDLLDGDEPDEKVPNCCWDRFDITINEFVPAWSLSALLELMPFIKLEGSDVKCEPKILKYISGEYLCSYEDEDFEVARLEKSPLDAAFEMMCWLLENGHLKGK